MRITAALTETRGAPFVLTPLELDDPRPGEVLVRMVSSGVCHTDLIIRDQWYPVPLPAVLGHEGAGVVEAVGDGVGYVRPGDHVVLTCATSSRWTRTRAWSCSARSAAASRPARARC
ncbi:alcohol dehydrogenase catalytic domain-containing protein [Nonomuraea zeae]|uniref:alcohol dehydrogenase catalytic domain-containing protein n=1 Tax=Nonomuraea zeae TaxID=1642303 RepID=UPI0023F25AC6|nr:alcohol dehydrogenase catalytic domain-containing protein [Nonomuraea zeae]